ncbi:uncharacterized protein LOC141899045 [Tubulanus polymorphus]|uniref:uncharacterized protein LOC141899045 n=1 Tax=Tubulanus polymorphus TaxID=672921 RepID=UPI003DA2AD83
MSAWLKIGDFFVLPWSCSGLESSIVVVRDRMRICFDIGYAHRETVEAEHVCITHGHIDHIAGIAHHTAKRDLYGMSMPTYYAPSHLVDTLKDVGKVFGKMQERSSSMNKMNVQGIDYDGEAIQLPWNRKLKAIKTEHTVKSQGYIIYKVIRTLKPAYIHLNPREIARLHKEGHVIHDIMEIPEVAYTGDTTIAAFLNPSQNPDIFKVKLLITEATYIDYMDNGRKVNMAYDRGHMHLWHIAENAELFKDVENILLVHFSDRYDITSIQQYVNSSVPPSLRHKVHLGLCKGALRE